MPHSVSRSLDLDSQLNQQQQRQQQSQTRPSTPSSTSPSTTTAILRKVKSTSSKLSTRLKTPPAASPAAPATPAPAPAPSLPLPQIQDSLAFLRLPAQLPRLSYEVLDASAAAAPHSDTTANDTAMAPTPSPYGRTGMVPAGAGPSAFGPSAHAHSQSVSYAASSSAAAYPIAASSPPSHLLPGQLAHAYNQARMAMNTHHKQRPSLPHLSSSPAVASPAPGPSSSVGRGVPRSPANSPRDANRPVRITGKPQPQPQSQPHQHSQSYAQSAHAHASNGRVSPGPNVAYTARTPPPLGASRPGTSPGVYAPNFGPTSTPGGAEPAAGASTPARHHQASFSQSALQHSHSHPQLQHQQQQQQATRPLISSVARGQPKAHSPFDSRHPSSPEGAHPVVALPLLDISPHGVHHRSPADTDFGSAPKLTPPMPRRVLADSFAAPAPSHAHQASSDHTSAAQVDKALPSAFTAPAPAKDPIDKDAAGQEDDEDEDEDDDRAAQKVPRASVAPSLLHPSQSLAAARALLPAEPDSVVTTISNPPPLPPKLAEAAAASAAAPATDLLPAAVPGSGIPSARTNSPGLPPPTPPPRGKSKPTVARKPAPVYKSSAPTSPVVSQQGGVQSAASFASAAAAEVEQQQSAPLLAAEWLMPLGGSTSPSSLGLSALPSAPGAATPHAEARLLPTQTDKPLPSRNSDAPPAVPDKDSLLPSSAAKLHLRTETNELLNPATLLDFMTSAPPRSPASVDSYPYPLSLLSMKDDDGRLPPITPEQAQGAFNHPTSPSSVRLQQRQTSTDLHSTLGLDNIDMLRQFSYSTGAEDEDTAFGLEDEHRPSEVPEMSRCSSGINSPVNKFRALQPIEPAGAAAAATMARIAAGGAQAGTAELRNMGEAPASSGHQDQARDGAHILSTQAAGVPSPALAEQESPARLMPMSIEEARAKALMAANRLRQQQGSVTSSPSRHVKKARSSGDLLDFTSRQGNGIRPSTATSPTSTTEAAPPSSSTAAVSSAGGATRQHAPAASEGKVLEHRRQLQEKQLREQQYAATALAARQEVMLAAQRAELHHLRFLVSALAARLAAAEAHMGLDLRNALGDPRVDELIRRSAVQLHQLAGQPAPEGGPTNDKFFEELAKVTSVDVGMQDPYDTARVAGDGSSGGGQPQEQRAEPVRMYTAEEPIPTPSTAPLPAEELRPTSTRSLRTSASSSQLHQLQQEQPKNIIGDTWTAIRRAKRARELAVDAARSRDTILTSTYSAQPAIYQPASIHRSGSNASSVSHRHAPSLRGLSSVEEPSTGSSSAGTRSAWTSFSTQATSFAEDGTVSQHGYGGIKGGSISGSILGRSGSLTRSASLGRSASGRAARGAPSPHQPLPAQHKTPPLNIRTHHTDRLGVHKLSTANAGLGLNEEAFVEHAGLPHQPERTPSPSYAGTDGKFRFPPSEDASLAVGQVEVGHSAVPRQGKPSLELDLLMPAITEQSEGGLSARTSMVNHSAGR
ncbi:hypothetical protein OC844_006635 [Tilletia horrida]|nr:hypothetical protein OC844_006635 [Tilletia horrida]